MMAYFEEFDRVKTLNQRHEDLYSDYRELQYEHHLLQDEVKALERRIEDLSYENKRLSKQLMDFARYDTELKYLEYPISYIAALSRKALEGKE